jgi:hypothetical protein
MRPTIIAIALFLAAPALAAGPTCDDLAASVSAAFSDFPSVVLGSETELMTWRASCAEAAPVGRGDVVRLCQADTSAGAVFYWMKTAEGSGTVGFTQCP